MFSLTSIVTSCLLACKSIEFKLLFAHRNDDKAEFLVRSKLFSWLLLQSKIDSFSRLLKSKLVNWFCLHFSCVIRGLAFKLSSDILLFPIDKRCNALLCEMSKAVSSFS